MRDASLSANNPVKPSPPARPSMWAHAYGGMQLAIAVLLGFYGGRWLDRLLGWSPWLTLSGAALGVLGGLYVFFSPSFRRGTRGDS